jgi:hypothetical protein
MDDEALEHAIDALADEYRSRCLWFLRPGFYPTTTAERLRVLDYVSRYGDTAGFRRASELRSWLSHPSSAVSSES